MSIGPGPDSMEGFEEEGRRKRDAPAATSPSREAKQSWAEAVVECVSDSAERERLIRLYDYDELVQACLALGTLALSAKHEAARNKELEAKIASATTVSATRRICESCGTEQKPSWQCFNCGIDNQL